jgi:hypothetical protein
MKSTIQHNYLTRTTDINTYNSNLPNLISQFVLQKHKVLEGNKKALEVIPFTIRRRDSIPEVLKVVEIKRKPEILQREEKKEVKPPSYKTSTINLEEYEYIINILKDMSLAMEKTPKTFAELEEEEIRDFFLILLNSHYEGSATGETFNGAGKTDIIIKEGGDNVFIAECKFWGGEVLFTKTIDQLFDKYITLRDSRVSVIVFVRDTNYSTVVSQVDEIVKKHKYYKDSEISFEKPELKKRVFEKMVFPYNFKNPNDNQRSVILTVMVFQIPEKTQEMKEVKRTKKIVSKKITNA